MRDCRVRDAMGCTREIDWTRATTVLRDWHGIEVNPAMHYRLRLICGHVSRLEGDIREFHRKQRESQRGG